MRAFKTGAVRDLSDKKGACHLLPPKALLLISKRFQEGAKKYGERNWEKGIPLSSFIDSGLRHCFQFMNNDVSEDHLVAAAINFLMAVETRERIREGILPLELDDIPALRPKKAPTMAYNERSAHNRMIYLASPYSSVKGGTAPLKLRKERAERAREEVIKVYRKYGVFVYSPVVYSVSLISKPSEEEVCFDFWRAFDFAMLGRCTDFVVLCLSGYEYSKGIEEEMNYAKKLALPIHYVKEFTDWDKILI